MRTLTGALPDRFRLDARARSRRPPLGRSSQTWDFDCGWSAVRADYHRPVTCGDASGRACVWFQETGAFDTDRLEAAASTLSPEELERAGRFRLARDRRDYIAAHALTRALLADCEGRPESMLA